jgi:hypothetical protein
MPNIVFWRKAQKRETIYLCNHWSGRYELASLGRDMDLSQHIHRL